MGWLATRRRKLLAAAAALLILFRTGLPWLVEDLLESEGSARLQGEVTIENVDLWVLRGAIAVEGFALWTEGTTPTDERPAGPPPRVSWQRLYTNIGWWNLLSRVARIEAFELDGLEVSVARLPDGSLDLPRLREVLAEAEERAEEISEPFVVMIDRATLRGALLRARDDIPGTPMRREVALPAIEVVNLSIGDPKSEEPGHLDARLDFEDGTIAVDARIRENAGRYTLATTLDVKRLPLVQLHVHDPRFAWTKSGGRLDGTIQIEVDTAEGVKISGSAAVSDLRIEVPGEDEPALAWRRLEINIEEIDVARQNASIARIALDGGGGILRPLDDPPSPLLPKRAAIPPGEAAEAEAGDRPDPVSPNQEPWTVRLGTLEVTDTRASILLEQGPVDIQVGRFSVSDVQTTPPAWSTGPVMLVRSSIGLGLDTGQLLVEILKLGADQTSSDTTAPIRVETRLREASTTIDAQATVVREPLAVDATLAIADAPIGRYADLSGASPVRIPNGSLRADLDIETRGDALTVAGPVTIEDLLVLALEGDEEDFSVAWEEFFLDIESLRTDPGGGSRSLDVRISELRLLRPRVQATRQDAGLFLPTTISGAGRHMPDPPTEDVPTPDASAEAPTPARPDISADATGDAPSGTHADANGDAPSGTHADANGGAPSDTRADATGDATSGTAPAQGTDLPAVRAAVDRLHIESGSLRFVDRAIRPNYRGELADLTFSVSGFAFEGAPESPSIGFDDLSLDLTAPGGVPFVVRAQTGEDGIEFDARLTRLPLTPFNPYVLEAANYTILDGEMSIEADLRWTDDGYDSDTELTFSNLDVGNDSGGTLFEDTFGITITAALALMRDVAGDIGLTVPIEGSLAEGSEIGIGSIVGQALTRAILGAIVSPLKMLGAVSTLGDKVTDITPAPIDFLPGRGDLTPTGREKAGAIGRVLAATPWVRLGLTGRTQAADIRGLQEIDVLADLGEDQGILGSLRNLASGGARDAIRRALQAGDTSALSPDDRTTLDELVAEKSVDDAQLRALARDRAEVLRTYLVEEYGAQPDQIEIADPLPSRTEGGSDVQVALIGRR